MKKHFIFVSLLLIFVFISGCNRQPKEEILILPNQEKIALLQEMQMPSKNTLLFQSKIDANIYERILSNNIDCEIKSYFDLNTVQSFTNYTNLDFDIKTPSFDGVGKANLYLNNQKAYLDVDTVLKVEGEV